MEQERKILRYSTHPLLIIAAIAVVMFCSLGIAAIMGWLPSSHSSGAQPGYAAAPMGPPVAEAPVQVGAGDIGPPPPPAAYRNNLAPITSGMSGAGNYGGGAAPEGRSEAVAAPPAAPQAAPVVTCRSCGVVESVRTVSVRGQGSGLGAAGGALVGGLLGHQIGGGTGRSIATVAGAVGGAVVGNQVEGNMKASHYYEVRVRMEDGSHRTLRSNTAWQDGDRVKVVKGHLQRR